MFSELTVSNLWSQFLFILCILLNTYFSCIFSVCRQLQDKTNYFLRAAVGGLTCHSWGHFLSGSPCTTPQGYCLAFTILLPMFTSSVLPTTAKGRWPWNRTLENSLTRKLPVSSGISDDADDAGEWISGLGVNTRVTLRE